MNYNAYNLEQQLKERRRELQQYVPQEPSPAAQLKVSIGMMMVTLFAVTVGMWFTFQSHAHTFQTNTLKMDSIYEEMGDVRGENTSVYAELQKTQVELASMHAALENLNDRISGLDSDQAAQIKVDIADLSKKFADTTLIKSSVDSSGQVMLEYPEDMVNILLVGENQGLTDTMMVAAVNPDTEKITLISVPRDLYVNGRKINSVYYHYGIDKLKQSLSDILGLKIHEYVVVDVHAFPAVVDVLGGVDIYVDKALYDNQYPNGRGGYQVVDISSGQHHMDGEMALTYARSRKSTSDFDRARRQQAVIQSLYRKVKELDLAHNKTKAIEMYNTVKEYVHTDLDVFSAIAYAKMFRGYEVEHNNVLSNTNYLYSMINASGAYVLLPNAGNYDEIKSYVFELVVE